LRYDQPKDPGLAAELEYRVDQGPSESRPFAMPDDWGAIGATPWAFAAMALAAIAVVWWIAAKRFVRG
jgi:hypothetical protein